MIWPKTSDKPALEPVNTQITDTLPGGHFKNGQKRVNLGALKV